MTHEACRPSVRPSSVTLTSLVIRKRIMDQSIKACLDAMVENRRFTYTDIFRAGSNIGATMHHHNLFVRAQR